VGVVNGNSMAVVATSPVEVVSGSNRVVEEI